MSPACQQNSEGVPHVRGSPILQSGGKAESKRDSEKDQAVV